MTDNKDLALGKLTPDWEMSCSLLPTLFGVSPYLTLNQQLELCHKALKCINIRSEPNNFMQVGNYLEKPIAQLTQARCNFLDIDYEITKPVRHKNISLNGSIDAIAVADNMKIEADKKLGIYTPESKKGFTINGRGIVEIKTSMFPVGEEPPLHKGVLQVKGLMACTGYDWAVISILHGTDLKMYFYERDFSWEKKELEIAVTDFNKRVPLLDYYSPFDSREAARINPQDNGETTELSKEAQLHLANIDTWKQQSDKLQKLIDEAKTKVMVEMDKAVEGYGKEYKVSYKTVSYKAQPEKTKVVPAKEAYTQRRFSFVKINK